MYENLLTVEQAKVQMHPLLKVTPHCALCGCEFDRITSRHLRTHMEYLEANKSFKWYKPKRTENIMTELEDSEVSTQSKLVQRPETLVETYERLFGGVNRLTACAKKLLDLYLPNRTKWLLMDAPIMPQYATWHQVTDNNPAFIPNRLCTDVLKEHLMFKSTVGVFSKSRYRTWFVTWDVDSKPVYNDNSWDPEDEARKAVLAIVMLLRKWGFHPHVIVSGGKGYHVTVYFQNGIPIATAMQLYRAVLQHPQGPSQGNGLKVECLPIQRGDKLPLGIHWASGKFTSFVDSLTLEPELDPYQYLLNIVPDNPGLITEIQDTDLAIARSRKSTVVKVNTWSKESTDAAYKLGVVAPGTRHDTLLKVAAFIRNNPKLCPETLPELIDSLLNWSKKQYEVNGHNINTRWNEHVRELYDIASYVWRHPLTGGITKMIPVPPSVVHWVRSKTPGLAAQQLLFAAWVESQMVGETFYFGYRRMRELTALAKNTTDKTIIELRNKRILVIEAEYSHSQGIRPSLSRRYRFSEKPPTSGADYTPLVVASDQWDPKLWFRLLRTLFTVPELKASYPFAYHRILKVAPLRIGQSSA